MPRRCTSITAAWLAIRRPEDARRRTSPDPEATFVLYSTPHRLEHRAPNWQEWAKWENELGFQVRSCTSSDQRAQLFGDIAIVSHSVRTEISTNQSESTLHEREKIVFHRRGGTPSRSLTLDVSFPNTLPERSVPPISSAISRASAIYLGSVGLALLFGGDALLPRLISGFPREAAWIGQLLAAAWLGTAFLNWNGRATILGGIYGRPVVVLNLTLYVVGALALVKVAHTPAMLWILSVPMSALGIAYGLLLLRGPFDPLTSA